MIYVFYVPIPISVFALGLICFAIVLTLLKLSSTCIFTTCSCVLTPLSCSRGVGRLRSYCDSLCMPSEQRHSSTLKAENSPNKLTAPRNYVGNGGRSCTSCEFDDCNGMLRSGGFEMQRLLVKLLHRCFVTSGYCSPIHGAWSGESLWH